MRFILEITTANSEGALERILGCLRQRGFSLCAMVADRSHDQRAIEIRLTLEGTRPMDTAVKQVSKLYDVMNVQVQSVQSVQSLEEGNGYRQLQASPV